jgi:hypothetical protein
MAVMGNDRSRVGEEEASAGVAMSVLLAEYEAARADEREWPGLAAQLGGVGAAVIAGAFVVATACAKPTSCRGVTDFVWLLIPFAPLSVLLWVTFHGIGSRVRTFYIRTLEDEIRRRAMNLDPPAVAATRGLPLPYPSLSRVMAPLIEPGHRVKGTWSVRLLLYAVNGVLFILDVMVMILALRNVQIAGLRIGALVVHSALLLGTALVTIRWGVLGFSQRWPALVASVRGEIGCDEPGA